MRTKKIQKNNLNSIARVTFDVKSNPFLFLKGGYMSTRRLSHYGHGSNGITRRKLYRLKRALKYHFKHALTRGNKHELKRKLGRVGISVSNHLYSHGKQALHTLLYP